MDLFIQQKLLQTNNSRTSVLPDNLRKESRKALQDLKKFKDVVIRPADKGSKFFILDREEYVQRVLVRLNDGNTFMEIDDNAAATESVKLAIRNWYARFGRKYDRHNSVYNHT